MINDLAYAMKCMGYDETDPMDFYRDIFPRGSLDIAGAKTKGKYTAIAVQIGKDHHTKRYTITDDLNQLEDLIYQDDFTVIAPVSYAGKHRTNANARDLYAIAIDLDYIKVKKNYPVGLQELIRQCSEPSHWGKRTLPELPMPTYLVCSGTGLHLYYLLDKPRPLYPDVMAEMQFIKRTLTARAWNSKICYRADKDDVQQEPLCQAMRAVGSITKTGDRVRAYKTGGRWSVADLCAYLPQVEVDKADKARRAAQRMPIAQARELYPDWYQRRVVDGQPRGQWVCNRALYDWWYNRIEAEAQEGHRYYCLMMLAVYAIKCDIPKDELRRDAMAMADRLNDYRPHRADNPLTRRDVMDAVSAWDNKSLATLPVGTIEWLSGLQIPRNKRNGRTQAQHCKIMRFVRDEVNGHADTWRNGNGRKPKQAQVQEWRAAHPNGRKADCIRDTGMDAKTVRKWWDA